MLPTRVWLEAKLMQYRENASEDTTMQKTKLRQMTGQGLENHAACLRAQRNELRQKTTLLIEDDDLLAQGDLGALGHAVSLISQLGIRGVSSSKKQFATMLTRSRQTYRKSFECLQTTTRVRHTCSSRHNPLTTFRKLCRSTVHCLLRAWSVRRTMRSRRR